MNPNTEKAIASLIAHGYVCKPEVAYEGGIDGFVTELKELFARYFDPGFVEAELALPPELIDFLQAIEGSYFKRNWAAVYGMEDVYSATKYELKLWEPEPEFRQMWINIGNWSDKHQLIMCVSKSHEDYGKVIDAYDDHPYCSDSFYNYQEWDDIYAYTEEPE